MIENEPPNKTGKGRIVSLVALLVLSGLAVLFAAIGADPTELFELAEEFALIEEQPTISATVVNGRDWWQVYFTEPGPVEDTENLVGPIPESLIAHINEAQNSIDIAAFQFNVAPVAEALIAASKRGVGVRWMTDDEFGVEEDEDGLGLFNQMEEAGVEVRDDDRGELMHNKFIVFDSQIVWTGSTNLTENGFFRNNNNVIVLDSPSLAADFQREFDEMWRGEFGYRAPSTESRQSWVVEGTPIKVYFAAEDHPVSSIVPLVEAAEKSVRFMAFSFTHDDLGSVMVAGHKDSVDVNGIFETRGSETEHSEFTRLYCAGVPVRLDGNPAILHHKVIIIDDRIVITGSANFSNSGDRFNDENLLVIDNKDIARLYIEEFDRRWAEAVDPGNPQVDC